MSSIERMNSSYLANRNGKANEAASTVEQTKTATSQKGTKTAETKTADLKTEQNVSGKAEPRRENQMVKKAIAEVNKKMNRKTRCEFSYHEDTKRVSIKVIDANTEEVIREIPPEETLDMLTKMWEAAGILIDETR